MKAKILFAVLSLSLIAASCNKQPQAMQDDSSNMKQENTTMDSGDQMKADADAKMKADTDAMMNDDSSDSMMGADDKMTK